MAEQKLTLVDYGQATPFWVEAEQWYELVRPQYHDARFSVTSAIAEYLANKQGLTLYASRATDNEETSGTVYP